MKRDWIWALNAVGKCRQAGYFAKNKAISAQWYAVADELEVKYLAGQPWLRTYDGKFK
jgi:hypothetical protein